MEDYEDDGPTYKELRKQFRLEACGRWGWGVLLIISIPVMIALAFAAWLVVLFVANLFTGGL